MAINHNNNDNNSKKKKKKMKKSEIKKIIFLNIAPKHRTLSI